MQPHIVPALISPVMVSSTESPPRIEVPWTLGDAVRASLVVVMGGLSLALLLYPILGWLGIAKGARVFIFAATLSLMFLAAAWRFGPRRYGSPLATLGFRTPQSGTTLLPWLVLLASLVLANLFLVIVNLTGLESLEPPVLPKNLANDSLDRIAMFVLVVLLGPLAEETFFRGFLLPVFVSRWGFVWGASVTALVFATTHGSLGLLVPTFMTGWLLAWLYYRTRSLWSCCVMHSAQNAIAFVLTFML